MRMFYFTQIASGLGDPLHHVAPELIGCIATGLSRQSEKGLAAPIADHDTSDHLGDVCREGFQDRLYTPIGIDPELTGAVAASNHGDMQAGRPSPLFEKFIEAFGDDQGCAGRQLHAPLCQTERTTVFMHWVNARQVSGRP